jgi:putative FmdB family regulatory protein
MPRYDYSCDVCGPMELFFSLSSYPGDEIECPSCGEEIARRAYTPPALHCHDPYIDEDITGSPIEITSPAHRDRILAEHNLSMDSAKYVRKPQRNNWEDGLDPEEVIAKASEHYAAKKNGKTVDGDPLETHTELPSLEDSAKV